MILAIGIGTAIVSGIPLPSVDRPQAIHDKASLDRLLVLAAEVNTHAVETEQRRLTSKAVELETRQREEAKRLTDQKAVSDADAKRRTQAEVEARRQVELRTAEVAKRLAEEKSQADQQALKRIADQRAVADADAKRRAEIEARRQTELRATEKARAEQEELKRTSDQKAVADADAKRRAEAEIEARRQAELRATEKERAEQEELKRIADQKAVADADAKRRADSETEARRQAEMRAAEEAQKQDLAKRTADAAQAELMEMTKILQTELRRVGCDPGDVDGKWGAKGIDALRKFIFHANINVASNTPSQEAIDAVVKRAARVCPQECSSVQKLMDGKCITPVPPVEVRQRPRQQPASNVSGGSQSDKPEKPAKIDRDLLPGHCLSTTASNSHPLCLLGQKKN
jgi:hypothetical protein